LKRRFTAKSAKKRKGREEKRREEKRTQISRIATDDSAVKSRNEPQSTEDT
jgi:hypothetical protein